MFRTMCEAELIPSFVRAKNGFRFWSLVELETVWPWFQVETIDCSVNEAHRGIVLAPSVPLLLDLLDGESNTAWVTQVQVVTPGDINGSGIWKMEVLTRLHEIADNTGRIVGYAYQVATGEEYLTITGLEPRKRRLLYKSKPSAS